MKRLIVGFAVAAVVFGIPAASWGSDFPDPAIFGEPVPMPGLPAGAGSGPLNPNGDYMVFHWGSGAALKEADWDGNEWTWNSMALGGLGWETWPSLGPDGNWLFYNTSTGGAAAFIYRSIKQPNGDWGPGVPLQGDIGSFFAAGAPMFYEDRLYLRQGHTGGGKERIYVSEYDPDTDEFGTPDATEFDSANINKAGSNNTAPYRIGNTLLFQSDRDGTYDIWRSTLNGGTWGEPTKLPSPINTDAHDECRPWYCEANSTLYFTRHVSIGLAYQSHVTPEPSTLALLTMGALTLTVGWWRRRRVA